VSSDWIQDHIDAVYRYARRRLLHSDAEDVVQQSFEALFRAAAEGREPEDAGAYLLGTARRRVADVLRQRARRPEPVSLPDGWEGYGSLPLPDEALQSAELRDLVHTALGLVPGAAARLLEDRYRRDLPVAQIAARLGTTAKAVEMRLRRARAAFLRSFREVGRDWLGQHDAPTVDGEGSSA
jgi:RNA polymerase sigma-70 factor (ECF subfamily)